MNFTVFGRKIRTAVVLSAACVAMVAVIPDSAQAACQWKASENANNKAEKAIEDGNFEQAIAYANEAIKISPTNPMLYARRGTAYLQKSNSDISDADRAIADFTKMMNLDIGVECVPETYINDYETPEEALRAYRISIQIFALEARGMTYAAKSVEMVKRFADKREVEQTYYLGQKDEKTILMLMSTMPQSKSDIARKKTKQEVERQAELNAERISAGQITSENPVVITLPRNTGTGYDNWQGYYNVPESVTRGDFIKTGDVYTFSYSFKSNVDITGSLRIILVDNSETATPEWWGELSEYKVIKTGISSNTEVSGTITLNANKTSSSWESAANRLMFQIDPASGAAGEPTLTFSSFSFENETKKREEQEKLMEQAKQEVKPKQARLQKCINFGIEHHELGNFSWAIKLYNEALELDPQNATVKEYLELAKKKKKLKKQLNTKSSGVRGKSINEMTQEERLQRIEELERKKKQMEHLRNR
jgi:tetratricopeptide (TPR) repeat protein